MQGVGEIFREKILDIFSDRFVPSQRKDFLERGVEPGNGPIQIDRHQTDIDRLNDRFVEFFEDFKLSGPGLLLLIEQAVFNRDGNVARDRPQNLDVFGREQRAVGGTAQPNHGHHPAAHHTGHVVMQHAPDIPFAVGG